MSLALRYLVETRKQGGLVVRTVSTTQRIDRLTSRYGLKVIETPVGFNQIVDYALKNDLLIGGEESGGITIKGHIPEGDGVLMGLLLLEIVAKSGLTLYEMVEDLLKEVGPAFYRRPDLRLSRPVAKKQMSEFLVERAPAQIGAVVVDQVSKLDGVKYLLNDGSWLLIRPSGTEPVVLTKLDGRTIAEAAEIAGTTPGAMKVRAHRGYVALRKALGAER